MFVNKLLTAIKSKRIFDLKYIVVELLLIFTGITLAASYNDYKNDKQDQKFLKEVITQIHAEIKIDLEKNMINIQNQKKDVKGYLEFIKNLKERNVAAINSEASKKIVSGMTDYFMNWYNYYAFRKLKEKDINLITNDALKDQVERYYSMMDKIEMDVAIFNADKKEIRPFIFNYFKNYDYNNFNYDPFTNVDTMANDNVFLNTVRYTATNYSINIESFELLAFSEAKKTLKALEDEYPFLKEK